MFATTLAMSENRPGAEAPDDDAVRLLVRRAKAGDHDAFERLVRQHENRALATAWRILGNREDALDAAQEAFLRLYRFLDRIDDGRELGAWIYRIVVNACLDLDKKRRRNRDVRESWSREAGSVSGGGEMEARLDGQRRGRAIAQAMARLPTRERAAIVLRDVEGLPTSEVARILGTSEVTVRSQICNARAKLREAYHQDETP